MWARARSGVDAGVRMALLLLVWVLPGEVPLFGEGGRSTQYLLTVVSYQSILQHCCTYSLAWQARLGTACLVP